jgi:four helix bundle protein
MNTTPRFDNPAAEGFRDLVVWQKGNEVAKQVYVLTKSFPPDERFGLISQMRRAAVSISSNIAEGQARHTTGEFVQFISHAEGSVAELTTQLILSIELGFITNETAGTCLSLLDEIRRMLNGLRRKLASIR